jgi:hypothetical protein
MGTFALHGVHVYIPKCIFCRGVGLLPGMAASVAQAAKRARSSDGVQKGDFLDLNKTGSRLKVFI